MRELLWFFASLAGAAILTALAVIVSPQSLFWKAILFGGIYVLLICALLIFLDMRRPLKERPRMTPLVGLVVFSLGFLGCSVWYFWPSVAPADSLNKSEKRNDRPKAVHDLYKSDFPELMKLSNDGTIELRKKVDGTPDGHADISTIVCLDFASKSKFYMFYINRTNTGEQTAAPAEFIGLNYAEIANTTLKNISAGEKDVADSVGTTVDDLIFTGRIYLYYDSEMSMAQRGQLESLFKSKGASIIFRGPDYPMTRWLQNRAFAK